VLFTIRKQIKLIIASMFACFLLFGVQHAYLHGKFLRLAQVTKAVKDIGNGAGKVVGKVTGEVSHVAKGVVKEVTEPFIYKGIINKITGFLKKSIALLLLASFFLGILASFTPCIYPMIPVTVGIITSQGEKTLGSNFVRSLSYVLGIATVYATLGYIASTTSLVFGQWVASPWFVIPVATLFLYLSGTMFGLYEIYIPKFLSKRNAATKTGSVFSTFVMGAITGTVASPCLTPALAMLLSFVGKLGRPVVGFFSLFLFALGMGMLLLIIGTFSGLINKLPKAGKWMIETKRIFGFMLIFMAVYFAKPILSEQLITLLYWITGIGVVGYYIVKVFKRTKKK